jgi:dihydrofolate reductase
MPPEKEFTKYFQDTDEAKRARRFFQLFHEKIYLDDNISNDNALLLSVYMACNAEQATEVTSSRSLTIFQMIGRPKDQFHVYVNRLLKQGMLEKRKAEGNLILSVKGLKAIKTLLAGEFGTKTFLIKSGETFSGRRLLEEMIFSKLKSDVKVCDPYVDVNTIDLFRAVTSKTKVRLLTSSVSSERQMVTEIGNFMTQYPDITIEVAIDKKKTLHDRYLIFHQGAVSFGTSLNHLGRRDTIVSWIPDDIKEALSEVFEVRWNESQLLTI